MELQLSPRVTRSFFIRQLATLTVLFVTLAGFGFPRQAATQEPKPLSEKEVIELLRGDVPSARIADLAKEKGIDFKVTSGIENELREAGATQELIDTLVKIGRGNSEEAKPKTGNITVKTKPGEAQVYLNDEFKGTTSPEGELRMPDIAPANYNMRVSKERYQTWEDEVTVSSGETQTVFVTLTQTSRENVPENPQSPPNVTAPSGNPVAPAAPQPQVIRANVASGTYSVPALNHLAVKFAVGSAQAQQARVVGVFRVGGLKNTIQVFVANEAEYAAWIENAKLEAKYRHQVSVTYATEKVSEGQINVPIRSAGTYYLVFNNRFSLLTPKQVSAKVELRYLAAQ